MSSILRLVFTVARDEDLRESEIHVDALRWMKRYESYDANLHETSMVLLSKVVRRDIDLGKLAPGEGVSIILRSLRTFPDMPTLQKAACSVLTRLCAENEECRLLVAAQGGTRIVLELMYREVYVRIF